MPGKGKGGNHYYDPLVLEENCQIVQVIGSRGGNVFEIQYPDKKSSLVLLPSKFKKKQWVGRGSFVIIKSGTEEINDKVTATITQIVTAQDQADLTKRGVWPQPFDQSSATSQLPPSTAPENSNALPSPTSPEINARAASSSATSDEGSSDDEDCAVKARSSGYSGFARRPRGGSGAAGGATKFDSQGFVQSDGDDDSDSCEQGVEGGQG